MGTWNFRRLALCEQNKKSIRGKPVDMEHVSHFCRFGFHLYIMIIHDIGMINMFILFIYIWQLKVCLSFWQIYTSYVYIFVYVCHKYGIQCISICYTTWSFLHIFISETVMGPLAILQVDPLPKKRPSVAKDDGPVRYCLFWQILQFKKTGEQYEYLDNFACNICHIFGI